MGLVSTLDWVVTVKIARDVAPRVYGSGLWPSNDAFHNLSANGAGYTLAWGQRALGGEH